MCFICDKIEKGDVVYDHKNIALIEDGYPVTEGHVLAVPKRCIANYFHLNRKERDQIHQAIYLYSEYMMSKDETVDGFNVGWNIGGSAGQTVNHAHCHLIPRRTGDCENPVGGVRHSACNGMGDYTK